MATGDFFEAVPPGGDPYVLKSVIQLPASAGLELIHVSDPLAPTHLVIEAVPD